MNPNHGISRDEWMSRFRQHIIDKAGLSGSPFADSIADAELGGWPDEPNGDWLDYGPEEAAVESLYCWSE